MILKFAYVHIIYFSLTIFHNEATVKPMKSTIKDFYTIQEFADYIGVHYNTVYNGIKRGHISAFRVGRGEKAHYRISHTEIQRLGIFHLDEIIDRLIDAKLKAREDGHSQS